MKNSELLQSLKDAVRRERMVAAEVISYLEEVQKRQLFAKLGFSSLFDFCVQELGYSESSAMRRINAMRIVKDIPEVKQALEEGTLSLTAVSQVQRFVKEQKIKDVEVKRQLLEDVRGKSTRQVEKHFAMIAPNPIPNERERVVTKDETEVRVVLNDRVMEKLKRIRDGWSHKNTNYSYAELIEAMADVVLGKSEKKLKPRIEASRVSARTTSAPQVKGNQSGIDTAAGSHLQQAVGGGTTLTTSAIEESKDWFSSLDPYADEDQICQRYISTPVKRAVWQRDQGKCQHPGCNSTFLIQLDHRKPRIFGGSNNLENLRLLCALHNRARAPFQQRAHFLKSTPTTPGATKSLRRATSS